MGARVSLSLNSLLQHPMVRVALICQPLIHGEPLDPIVNPLVQVANVDFYIESQSQLNAVDLLWSAQFDVVMQDDGKLSLECDYNVFRGSEHVIKLQRMFFEYSLPHYVIPA